MKNSDVGDLIWRCQIEGFIVNVKSNLEILLLKGLCRFLLQTPSLL